MRKNLSSDVSKTIIRIRLADLVSKPQHDNMKKSLLILLIAYSVYIHADSIRYFEIENHDSSLSLNEALKQDQFYQVFIFPTGCFPCTKNRFIWNRMATSFKLKTYGIVLESKFLDLYDKTGYVKFRLYCPVDVNEFMKQLNLNGLYMYTLLLKGRNIIYEVKGLIRTEDYFKIKKMVVNNL